MNNLTNIIKELEIKKEKEIRIACRFYAQDFLGDFDILPIARFQIPYYLKSEVKDNKIHLRCYSKNCHPREETINGLTYSALNFFKAEHSLSDIEIFISNKWAESFNKRILIEP